MSFRPTIAVYAGGKIADIGYYRDWSGTGLLLEAAALGALFRGCPTAEDFRQAVYGGQQVFYRIDPETVENTEENMKMLEGWSEFPVVVDLTAGYIYRSYGCLSLAELAQLPVYGGRVSDLSGDDHLRLLAEYRIPIGGEEVLALLRGSPELRERLSARTLRLLLGEREKTPPSAN